MDEQSIFLNALEQNNPEARAVWLDEACGDDHALKQRILDLLKKHEAAGSFLEKPPEGLDATMVHESSDDKMAASMNAGLTAAFSINEAIVLGDKNHSVLKMLGNTLAEVPRVSLWESQAQGEDPISRPSSAEMPGRDKGNRYQLQGEIARGGMGAILKGRDTDLGRDLAIKVLLDSHKDNPQVIQRFVEEAQIGGQLQHPGIAPVYELGQFADQRPFFSMKLVKGDTLAKLLAQRSDATVERAKFIGIFEQICQTMAYAHSRGVIHRDLKPANIMVGAFGEVQVMDWGLAKVLQSGGVADEKKAMQSQQGQSIIQTMRSGGSGVPGSFGSTGSDTQMGSVMGTPAYMPPEQALGEIDQLDQRADVFGLGAILTEILTGKPPYVGENGTQVYRMASRGKLEDAFARLDACAADAELITLSKHCLALEPANRPGDASVVAERVTAYLESVEQKLRDTELAKVDAQVRAEELQRRQRLAYTAGTAIVATLLIGTSASLWQMFRANTAEQLARSEANRATTAEKATADTLAQVEKERDAKELARQEAEQISTFLSEVLQSPDPAKDGREIKVVELLDNAAKKLETDLADQPERRAKLQVTLGKTYFELGLFKQAIPLQEQARDHFLATVGPEHQDTLGAIHGLANSYDAAGRLDEALKMREEVLRLRRNTFGPEHPDTLGAMNNLAVSYFNAGRRDEALQMREEVLVLYRKVLGPEHPETLSAIQGLAISYHAAGRLDEALKLREEALRLRRNTFGPEHPDTLGAMNNLAVSYFNAGRRDEALQMREEVLVLYRKVLGPEHRGTLKAMNNLSNSYFEAGRRDEALKMSEEALALGRKVLGPEHPDTLGTINNLARSYIEVGRQDEALKLSEEALALQRMVLGPEHPSTLTTMGNLAAHYYDANLRDEALKLREEVLPLCRKVLGPEHHVTLSQMYGLSISYSVAGRRAESMKLEEELLALRRRVLGPEHPDTLSAMYNLAFSYNASGRRGEAITLYEEALLLRRKVLGPEHLKTLETLNNLANLYYSDGRRDESLKMREEVLALRRKVLGPEHPHTLIAMRNMAVSYFAAGRRDEAMKMREEVLELRRKVLPPNAPDTLISMKDLVISYETANRRDEALKMKKEILELRRETIGAEHPDTIEAMNNLAAYYPAEQKEEALKLREEVLELRSKVLGPKHSDTISAMGNLAISYNAVGRWDEAIEMQKKFLELRREAHGAEHPNTIEAMNNLAVFYPADQKEEALKLREEVLALRSKVLGPKHSDTISAMANLAFSYNAVSRWDEAIEIQKKALELRSETLGAEHPDTIEAMNNLVSYYHNAGIKDEALRLSEQQVGLLRTTLGQEHLATRTAMHNLASYYEAAARLVEAIKLREELVALTPNDPKALNDMAWRLAITPDKKGGYPGAAQAVKWAQRATELEPSNAGSLNTLGVALYRTEQWQNAVDTIQKSIELGDDIPHNWLFLAMSHWHLDQKDKAKEWYDKALAWQTANAVAARDDAELQAFFTEAANLMGPEAEDERKRKSKANSDNGVEVNASNTP